MAGAAQQVADDYARVQPTAGAAFERQETILSDAAARPGNTTAKLLQLRPDLDKRYVNRVRLGGIKFWLDGSLPTAWMSQPYASPPPGAEPGYRAYQQIPDAVLQAAFDRHWTSNVQLNMHMNGDAAAEQALRAIEMAIAKHGMADHRPVFIHATYLRPDQIERLKAVGGVPSFLTTGLIPGGDAVLKLWGPERAASSMAAATMLKQGIPFTFSHDAPVSPQPWVLALVDAAVNRRSASGVVIGPNERVTAEPPQCQRRGDRAQRTRDRVPGPAGRDGPRCVADQGRKDQGHPGSGQAGRPGDPGAQSPHGGSGHDQGHRRCGNDQGGAHHLSARTAAECQQGQGPPARWQLPPLPA
jgi:predicted amidohydrolase YtcJ